MRDDGTHPFSRFLYLGSSGRSWLVRHSTGYLWAYKVLVEISPKPVYALLSGVNAPTAARKAVIDSLWSGY